MIVGRIASSNPGDSQTGVVVSESVTKISWDNRPDFSAPARNGNGSVMR
jgi:hypothetical protein